MAFSANLIWLYTILIVEFLSFFSLAFVMIRNETTLLRVAEFLISILLLLSVFLARYVRQAESRQIEKKKQNVNNFSKKILKSVNQKKLSADHES